MAIFVSLTVSIINTDAMIIVCGVVYFVVSTRRKVCCM